MSVKLRKENDPMTINMHDMEDGDIGEIINWNVHDYIGRIVQRYGQHLLSVGQRSGKGWAGMFNAQRDENRRVRILEPGEVLEIV